MDRTILIYDLEITPFSFLYGDFNIKTGKYSTFVLSQFRDDRIALKKYLYEIIESKSYQVGFNNLNYDYPMIHFLLSLMKQKRWETRPINEIIKALNEKNKVLIPDDKSKQFNKFGKSYNIIRNPLIPQIDLFKIHHWDNKARRASLKKIEISMRFKNVQDFDWEYVSTNYNETIENQIIKYNKNDIDATKEIYYLTRGQLDKVTVDFPGMTKWYNADRIQYRINVSKKYGFNAINYSDVKIGEELNRINYLKKTGISWNDLKWKKTHRTTIHIKDIIPKYIFDLYKDEKLKKLLKDLLLVDIDVNDPKFSYKLIFKDLIFAIGLGGIHADTNKSYIIEAKTGELFDERDVGSEYPTAIITLGLYPEHLGPEWNEMISESYHTRMTLKHKNEITANDTLKINTLKLAMNGGAYGKLNDKYSWQYDPLQTYRVTIKCQLDILLYIQMLSEQIKNIKFESANTDSVNIIYPKEYLSVVDNIDREWKSITGAEMERTAYKRLVRKDVNNYIVVKANDKIKLKGIFELERELHKTNTNYIVSLAVVEYFIKHIPIEQTIKNNNNIFNFLSTIKVQNTKQGGWVLYHAQIINNEIKKTKIQKINRYYVCNDNNSNIIKESKENKDKWSHIESGYNTKPLNIVDKTDTKYYDINYSYYITKARKIINEIEDKQLKLF